MRAHAFVTCTFPLIRLHLFFDSLLKIHGSVFTSVRVFVCSFLRSFFFFLFSQKREQWHCSCACVTSHTRRNNVLAAARLSHAVAPGRHST